MYPGIKVLIPSDAFLFFPKDTEKKKSSGLRLIFQGNTRFDDSETQKIQELKDFAAKSSYLLKPIWTDDMILRYLQANGFKLEKTLASIKEYTNWKESKFPLKYTDQMKEFLEAGYIYTHGRDKKFRPIIIFNAYRFDIKIFDVDLIIDSLTYFLEFMVQELLLPGQVENWIFIIDLKEMGLTATPPLSFKKLLTFLQYAYRGRLYAIYIVNTPSTVYIPWQIATKFFEETTVRKIEFLKTQVPEPLLKYTNLNQVEVKYGGTAPNVTRYWPPEVVPAICSISHEDNKKLITNEEYMFLYKNGHLKNFKVDKERIYTSVQMTEAEEKTAYEVYNLPTLALGSKKSNKSNKITSFPNPLFKDQNDCLPHDLDTEGADYRTLMDEKFEFTNEANIPKFMPHSMDKSKSQTKAMR